MAKKYYWTRQEETKLLELWKKGITDVEFWAKELDRKPLGVKRKLQRMGLLLVSENFRKEQQLQ